MKPITKKWGHDELARDLAGYLRETKGVLAWEDMQLGPQGSPRPDVYTIGKSFARFTPIAYECKVSVADFRRDVTAGKWQAYLAYASAVVFAAPAGLISKEDLPPGCGLIVRSDAGWRIAKGPTLGSVDNLPRNAWLKLFMDGVGREAERHQHHIGRGTNTISTWVADERIRKRHGGKVAELVSRALRAEDGLERAIELYDQKCAEREALLRDIENDKRELDKWHRERIERQMTALTSEQQCLAVTLGLSADATVSALTNAVREAHRRLGEDDEIRRLRRFFDQVKGLADQGLEPLPGTKLETT